MPLNELKVLFYSLRRYVRWMYDRNLSATDAWHMACETMRQIEIDIKTLEPGWEPE